MNVVRHQTVALQGKAVHIAVVPQQIEIDKSVGIGGEDESTTIPALRDMMRNINRHSPPPVLPRFSRARPISARSRSSQLLR